MGAGIRGTIGGASHMPGSDLCWLPDCSSPLNSKSFPGSLLCMHESSCFGQGLGGGHNPGRIDDTSPPNAGVLGLSPPQNIMLELGVLGARARQRTSLYYLPLRGTGWRQREPWGQTMPVIIWGLEGNGPSRDGNNDDNWKKSGDLVAPHISSSPQSPDPSLKYHRVAACPTNGSKPSIPEPGVGCPFSPCCS